MDNTQDKTVEEKKDETVENTDSQLVEEVADTPTENPQTENLESAPLSEEAAEEANTELEEKPEEIEAPEKMEEIEAPKEERIEATEEDGEKTEEAEEETKEEPASTSPSDLAKWYIVHTYSGHENKVAKSLHQRIESMGFEERIFDIIVPTRDTVKVSQGKKETVKEKIFPGYVLVKMILDDESWLLVRTTQGVTAFIGAGNKPSPISTKEVEAIQKFMATEEPLFKAAFTVGEAVKIVDGPFTDFLGTIDNIDEAKGKLKVLVSIFGRETPVELDFLQVSKL